MAAKRPAENAEKVFVKTRGEWRDWLKKNYKQTAGVWLVSYKKHSPHYLPYNEIVEEALCFGWVDSLPRKLDADRSMLYLSPRKKGSTWSKANKERIERLVKSKLMYSAGMAKVKEAKADGAWSFLDDIDAEVWPADLVAAFAKSKKARKNYEAFPPSTRRYILEWIKHAKRPETRAKRIYETVQAAAKNIRVNQVTKTRNKGK